MARRFGEAAKEVLLCFQDLGELVLSGRGASPRAIAYFLLSDRDHRKYREQEKKYQQAVQNALKNRLVVITEKPDGIKVVQLTERGECKIREFRFIDIKLSNPGQWDGKWRVVIFDVPVQKSRQRKMFTDKIKELGFIYLQKSVWVFPHPCFPEIEFVATELGIREFINFIETLSLREDTLLKKCFEL